jgi:hypothetical protein
LKEKKGTEEIEENDEKFKERGHKKAIESKKEKTNEEINEEEVQEEKIEKKEGEEEEEPEIKDEPLEDEPKEDNKEDESDDEFGHSNDDYFSSNLISSLGEIMKTNIEQWNMQDPNVIHSL